MNQPWHHWKTTPGDPGRDVPYRMAILADLGVEQPEPFSARKLHHPVTTDGLIETLQPCLTLRVDNRLTGRGEIELEYQPRCLADISVAGLIECIPPLQQLASKHQQLAQDATSSAANETESADSSAGLLDQILASDAPQDDTSVEIANLLVAQCREVLRHPKLQEFVGNWLALDQLLQDIWQQSEIWVAHATQSELRENLQQVSALEECRLYQWLSGSTLATAATARIPFSVALFADPFSAHPDDLDLLGGLSVISSITHCPLLLSAAATITGSADWQAVSELDASRVRRHMTSVDYAAYKSLRQSEDSRYLCLTAPGQRLTAPVPSGEHPIITQLPDVGSLVMHGRSSSAFPLLARIQTSLAATTWVTDLRGDSDSPCDFGEPTVALDSQLVGTLAEQGLCCLDSKRLPTFHLAETYGNPHLTASSQLAAEIGPTLATSRIVQMLLEAARSCLDKRMSAEQINPHLEQVLAQLSQETDGFAPLARGQAAVSHTNEGWVLSVALHPSLNDGAFADEFLWRAHVIVE